MLVLKLFTAIEFLCIFNKSSVFFHFKLNTQVIKNISNFITLLIYDKAFCSIIPSPSQVVNVWKTIHYLYLHPEYLHAVTAGNSISFANFLFFFFAQFYFKILFECNGEKISSRVGYKYDGGLLLDVKKNLKRRY